MYVYVFLVVAVIVIAWQYRLEMAADSDPAVQSAKMDQQSLETISYNMDQQVDQQTSELASVEAEILALGGTLDVIERMTADERAARLAYLKAKRKELKNKLVASKKAQADARAAVAVAKAHIAQLKKSVKSSGNMGLHLGQLKKTVEETESGDPDVMDNEFDSAQKLIQ